MSKNKLKNYYLNLFFLFLYFFCYHYFLLAFIFFTIYKFSLYAAILFFICFILSFLFYKSDVHFACSLSLLPLIIGAIISYIYPQSFEAYVYYFAFAIIAGIGYLFSPYKYKNIIISKTKLNIKLYFLLILFILLSIFIPYFVNKNFHINEDFFVPQYLTLKKLRIGNNDIPPAPLHPNYNFIPIILFFILSMVFYFVIINKKIKNTAIILFFLVIIAFLIKPVIANLSGYGIKIMEMKTVAKINTAYYYFAKNNKDNIIQFVNEYTTKYQDKLDHSHLKGHPPGPVILYWILGKIVNFDDLYVALLFSFITSLTVIPLFYITLMISKNLNTAIFSSLLFSFTPGNAILSVAGCEGMITFLLALIILFLFQYTESNRITNVFIAGFLSGVAGGLTFGIWVILIFLLIGIFIKFYENHKINFENFLLNLKIIIFFISGILIYFLIFYLIFPKYNYYESFLIAKKYIADVIKRPAWLWSWFNFIHWSLYMTATVITLYFYRFIKYKEIKIDAFSLLSIFTIFTTFLSIMGRGEQQRQWLFLIVFLIPIASISLLKREKKEYSFDYITGAIFLFLTFIQCFIIELIVSDTV